MKHQVLDCLPTGGLKNEEEMGKVFFFRDEPRDNHDARLLHTLQIVYAIDLNLFQKIKPNKGN